MKRSYLSRVYAFDKKLFLFIACFAGLTLLCNLSGNEVTPFFVWGMYSQREKAVGHYEFLQTRLENGKVLDPSSGYTDNTRFFLNSPLVNYKAIRDNAGVDPTRSFLERKLGSRYRRIAPLEDRIFNGPAEQQAFPEWYRRYLQTITGSSIQTLSLWAVKVHYDDYQHIVTDSTYLFEKWSKP